VNKEVSIEYNGPPLYGGLLYAELRRISLGGVEKDHPSPIGGVRVGEKRIRDWKPQLYTQSEWNAPTTTVA